MNCFFWLSLDIFQWGATKSKLIDKYGVSKWIRNKITPHVNFFNFEIGLLEAEKIKNTVVSW